MKPVSLAGAAFLALLFLPAAQAVQLAAMAEGSFGFRASVEGEMFEARFLDYSVVPQLGADRRPTGFAVEIRLSRIDSQNPDRDSEMRSAEWFDTATHPVASFQADEVETGPGGGHVAKGDLLIKGILRSVRVPFSWQIGPRRLHMAGEVGLDRRWFDLGPEDVTSIAADVTVFFDLSWAFDDKD